MSKNDITINPEFIKQTSVDLNTISNELEETINMVSNQVIPTIQENGWHGENATVYVDKLEAFKTNDLQKIVLSLREIATTMEKTAQTYEKDQEFIYQGIKNLGMISASATGAYVNGYAPSFNDLKNCTVDWSSEKNGRVMISRNGTPIGWVDKTNLVGYSEFKENSSITGSMRPGEKISFTGEDGRNYTISKDLYDPNKFYLHHGNEKVAVNSNDVMGYLSKGKIDTVTSNYNNVDKMQAGVTYKGVDDNGNSFNLTKNTDGTYTLKAGNLEKTISENNAANYANQITKTQLEGGSTGNGGASTPGQDKLAEIENRDNGTSNSYGKTPTHYDMQKQYGTHPDQISSTISDNNQSGSTGNGGASTPGQDKLAEIENRDNGTSNSYGKTPTHYDMQKQYGTHPDQISSTISDNNQTVSASNVQSGGTVNNSGSVGTSSSAEFVDPFKQANQSKSELIDPFEQPNKTNSELINPFDLKNM